MSGNEHNNYLPMVYKIIILKAFPALSLLQGTIVPGSKSTLIKDYSLYSPLVLTYSFVFHCFFIIILLINYTISRPTKYIIYKAIINFYFLCNLLVLVSSSKNFVLQSLWNNLILYISVNIKLI